jgi:co-chaperonin GroES (HSP10)
MGVVTARKTAMLAMATDPKKALFDAVGDLSGYDIFHNQILVATYVRPEITAGGIIRPGQNVDEDEYQGKVGLVVKVGPTAFLDTDDQDFCGQSLAPGDWVVYRTGDGWQLTIRDTACRILTDRTIRMRIQSPGDIF